MNVYIYIYIYGFYSSIPVSLGTLRTSTRGATIRQALIPKSPKHTSGSLLADLKMPDTKSWAKAGDLVCFFPYLPSLIIYFREGCIIFSDTPHLLSHSDEATRSRHCPHRWRSTKTNITRKLLLRKSRGQINSQVAQEARASSPNDGLLLIYLVYPTYWGQKNPKSLSEPTQCFKQTPASRTPPL